MKSLKLKPLIGIVYVLIIAGLAGGCASVYTAPDFGVYKYSHEVVAIVPFDVSINPGNKSEDVSAEELAELEEESSKTFQRALYTQFLAEQQYGRYTITFQDIDETNTLLKRHFDSKATKPDLSLLTKSEICEILAVDAVISGSMTLTKPMGTGAAIASLFLLGFAGSTNEAYVNISIHEEESGKLLWNYEHEAAGTIGSSPERVAKSLMSGIASYFPYSRY